MSALKFLSAMGGVGSAPVGNGSLYEIISDLGLTTNLKLCLDAGDSASYDPAVQTDKWLDTSGNGYDFFRGDGSTSSTFTTFNGTAGGLSSSEYFSFDGGDYFTYDATNEDWMNALHGDGAIWSWVFGWRPAGLGTHQQLLGTSGSTSGVGIKHGPGNSTGLSLYIYNSTSSYASAYSGGTFSNGSDYIVGISTTEGSSGIKLLNGTTGTFASNISKANSGPATNTMKIGAAGDKSQQLQNGSRLYFMAMWQGTQLTSQNLTDIYNAIKGRFGL